jgi:phosphoribosylamine---glycine ligase
MAEKAKILVLGSGGREHVFAWKLAEDLDTNHLFVATGNAGTSQVGTNVPISINDFEALAAFCIEEGITLVLPGSEDPLVNGITDYFAKRADLSHIYVFGPSEFGATLEGSKDFAKAFMARHGIPTAKYETFTGDQLDEAYAFLDTLTAPYVLKADGLAAGKGVLILENLEEAKIELTDMLLNSKFGAASKKVVIEEFLDGIEFSVFVMTDGDDYLVLPEAKDYKRIGESDTGLNTGGMGSVSPVPFMDKQLRKRVENDIIKPTMDGLKKDDMEYKGFVFIGLMNIDGVPKVIEYNVRMGDPETEVVFPRVKNSLLNLLEAARDKRLKRVKLEIDSRYCCAVFMVSGGYPQAYEKGKSIEIPELAESIAFHAGTKADKDNVVTNGGRVLALSSFGQSMAEALESSYRSIDLIHFDGAYWRKDIGVDLTEYTKTAK